MAASSAALFRATKAKPDRATGNLPMGGYKHTGVANASARTDYAAYGQVQDSGSQYLTGVAGADTIAASVTGLAAYATGQTFRFVSAGANTGAVTLNINTIGNKAVTKTGTTALAAGDIPSGAVVEVVYDGTRFQLLGVGDVTAQILRDQLFTAYTTAGSSGAYTLTTTYGALVTGERFRAKFHTAGPASGTNTLDRDTLGAKALKRYDPLGAKVDATITSGLLTDIEYDGTDFVVLAPLDLPHAKQRFTSDGTFTVPLGVTTVYVSGAGAGGGGAGVNAGTRGGGGGGGGQCVIAESISVTPGAAIAVGIGTGGSGGGAGINGNSGSKATTFGGLLSLAAGSGGNYSTGAGGSSGGSGGSAGGWGGGQSGVDTLTGGIGGGTCFGMGGAGGNAYSQIGQVGSGYGSGGGGGGQLLAGTQGAGGDGRPGFLLVEW